MMITEITNETLTQVTSLPGFQVVKVYSPTCMPCQRIAEHYEKVASHPDFAYAKFFQADAKGECSDIVEKYNIKQLPTILLFHFGGLIDELIDSNVCIENLYRALEANVPVDMSDYEESI